MLLKFKCMHQTFYYDNFAERPSELWSDIRARRDDNRNKASPQKEEETSETKVNQRSSGTYCCWSRKSYYTLW